MPEREGSPLLVTEDAKRAYAIRAADEMVASLRESNKAFEARTGLPSTVAEHEYVSARDEIETALLRVAGLKPRGEGVSESPASPHPEALTRLEDFERRGIAYQPPVHDLGVCPACDAWRLIAEKTRGE